MIDFACIDWENFSLYQVRQEKNSLFWIRIILYQWFTGAASNGMIPIRHPGTAFMDVQQQSLW